MRSCLDVSKAQFSGQEKIHCLFLHVSFTFNSTFIKDLDFIFQGDRGPIGLPGAPGKDGMPGMKGAQGVVSLHLFFDECPAHVNCINTYSVLIILIFFHPQWSTIKKSLNSSTVQIIFSLFVGNSRA